MGILPEYTSVQDAHAVPVEGEEGTGPLDMEGQTNASSRVDAENWACPPEGKAVLLTQAISPAHKTFSFTILHQVLLAKVEFFKAVKPITT